MAIRFVSFEYYRDVLGGWHAAYYRPPPAATNGSVADGGGGTGGGGGGGGGTAASGIGDVPRGTPVGPDRGGARRDAGRGVQDTDAVPVPLHDGPRPARAREVQERGADGDARREGGGLRRAVQGRRAHDAAAGVQPGREFHGVQLEQGEAAGIQERGERRCGGDAGPLADPPPGRSLGGDGAAREQPPRRGQDQDAEAGDNAGQGTEIQRTAQQLHRHREGGGGEGPVAGHHPAADEDHAGTGDHVHDLRGRHGQDREIRIVRLI